ncbi:hypothetical protein [Methylobacterium soli]|uniref:Ribosomal protein S27 n=1 Tax=Methylobacterium soli TaxID=553447 RepID=A0A6L3T0E3_9HYPH|nr:hypothetical protein [Methylobacterium soli]KAB1079395.1 hypothetical protein F6X53_11370 [Methylobacterium soli]GJE42071.1 hypothetical protein AEGHOMDF_1242 [Methylobacterium soli]
MPLILAVVLICAPSVAAQDCSRDTALDVRVLGTMPTPFPCLMGGMATLARSPDEIEGRYAKTVCERRKR